MFSRRTFLAGLASAAASPALAQTTEALTFEDFQGFVSDVSVLGKLPDPSKEDVIKASQILSHLPTSDAYSIMTALSEVKERGSTGELFIARWKKYGNPLLIQMFRDIGYTHTPDPGDCTSWCAASLAWCLKRSGKNIPENPASSQSFKDYGSPIQLAEARTGDICVFTNISDSSHGHVGFYSGSNTSKIMLLGGNQASSGATNCSKGYGQSRIETTSHYINPKKNKKLSHQFLSHICRS